MFGLPSLRTIPQHFHFVLLKFQRILGIPAHLLIAKREIIFKTKIKEFIQKKKEKNLSFIIKNFSLILKINLISNKNYFDIQR